MNNQYPNSFGFESINQFNFPNIVNLCVIRGDCPCFCIHCPVGKTSNYEREKRFGKTTIEFSLFEKIANEMNNFSHSTLRIHGVGEPLLWTELPDALQITSKLKVRSWLFTCLITHDEKLLETLALSCSIIEISLNSIDAENYRHSKGVNAFETVVKNIKTMREFITSNNLDTRIIASRVQSSDQSYDNRFVSHWKESNLFDDVFIRSYHDYNSILDNKFQQKPREISQCLVHWNRFNIDCDGSAVVCFNELFKDSKPDKEMLYGNVYDSSISNLWHCKNLTQIRKAQMEKDYSIVDFTNRLPCENCTSCQPAGKKGVITSEHQIHRLEKGPNAAN
jgi:pyruvate-formate lyase-activating enzyme